MPEINVSRLLGDIDTNAVSGSIATHGPNAAKETWAAALEAAEEPLAIEDRDGVREWAKGFGAWEEEEIAAWDDAEMDALVIQYAAQDLKELQDLAPGKGLGGINWRKAERLSQEGTCGGNLFVSGPFLYIHLE